MGCPFAQEDLEIAPRVMAGPGNTTRGADASRVEGEIGVQIGLGSALVIFFVPQPTNVRALASKKVRRASCLCACDSEAGCLSDNCIKEMYMSVSSNTSFCLQNQRNGDLKVLLNEDIIGAIKV